MRQDDAVYLRMTNAFVAAFDVAPAFESLSVSVSVTDPMPDPLRAPFASAAFDSFSPSESVPARFEVAVPEPTASVFRDRA